MTKNEFGWSYEYDEVGEAPRINITGPDHWEAMEVYLDPKPLVESPGLDDDHWRIPVFVIELVKLLNDDNMVKLWRAE